MSKKLADLLYPNLKLTVEDLEKKYPPRKTQGEVTRFAPSPTGYLHMGGFFSTIIDSRIAKETNGIFYLRIEDTDKKREIKGANIILLDVFNELGVVFNECPLSNGDERGKYGPYVQSQRLEIYEACAKLLVEKGLAFPCFCQKTEGKQDVMERRERELEENDGLSDKDSCRNLSFEEIEKNIKEGKAFALRLKSKAEEGDRIKVYDEIRGEREMQANNKDIILMKSDGIPPYAFAHAVDDHFMRTTLVVRGTEWFPSLPAHLEIFDALGFSRVKYLHTPEISLLDNGNRRKLSKRKDPEADMRFFIKNGYLISAVEEYLLNLINSNFEIWRAQNPLAPSQEFSFDIKKINATSPLFDIIKLNDISKNIISKLTAEEVYDKVLEWAKTYNADFAQKLADKARAVKIFNIDREMPKPRKDIYNWGMVSEYYSYFFEGVKAYEIEGNELGLAREVAAKYADIYSDSDDKEAWFAKIKEMAEKLGYATDNKDYKANPEKYKGNVAKACEYIRVAVTGLKNSPDLYEICRILGGEVVKNRLKAL